MTYSNHPTTKRTRKWRAANRDKHNQYMRDYRSSGIEQMFDDPAELWFEKDPRKRKALKQATPIWANHEEIRRMYKKCMELNQKYPGLNFVVHHRIPITHPQICGLHIVENMEIVSSSRKKQLGRKFNSNRTE